MALSNKTKLVMKQGLADINSAKEVIAAIDANSARVSTVVAAIATADATDLPTAIALANSNKAKVNELIAALKTAGLMATS